MKTPHMIKSVAALVALMAAGSASAEVGIRDGADQFSGFTSSRTRAEVQDEISNPRSQGLSESNRINSAEANIGAYGAVGSRYSSMLERKEVRDQMTNGESRPLWNPSYIYFGD